MFFYGTLKRGERNHERFCAGAIRVEEGTLRGDLYDVHLGYPALVVPEGSIFAFDDPESRLPALDRLEGFDPTDASSHYRRVLLPVETNEGSVLLAWAYVVEESSGSYLPGGRWPP